VRNFGETASAAKRKPPGREPSLRTPENIEQVRQAFVRTPQLSASRNAIVLRMSDRTVRRILHEDLNFHPYKMVVGQAINDQDTVNWKTVCEALCNVLQNDDFNHFLMLDEAHFRLCGNVNSQNCRYWANENPREIQQQPLHSENVIVWCGVGSFGVIGPYFFEDEAGRAVTVNSARYTEMLCTFLEPELQRLGVETQTLWFQQACHFFLWGYLKSKVYENKPRTTMDLKQNIRDEVAAISPTMLLRVLHNFQKHLRKCVDNNGCHLTDTIFRK
jgi:hypothetical protein